MDSETKESEYIWLGCPWNQVWYTTGAINYMKRKRRLDNSCACGQDALNQVKMSLMQGKCHHEPTDRTVLEQFKLVGLIYSHKEASAN